MIRLVQCEMGTVEYDLVYKSVKNINLRVERSGAVHVSAPKRVSPERVDEFVRKNAGFVFKARARYAALSKTETGVVYYLGKRYESAVRQGTHDRVVTEEGRIVVETTRPDDESGAKLLLSTYEEEMCKRLFPDVVRRLMPLMEPYGVRMPKISLRTMRTRWGSCTPAAGSIRLNTRLIHYPLRCIEQVALHELCHFVRPDHSAEFYALMTRLMPDWRARKKELDEGRYDCVK